MELLQKHNLQYCENCKLYYFPDIENNTIPNECNICKGTLIDTEISFEEYKNLSKAKRCPKCKRKYPKIFVKCSKCNTQLMKLSTENKQRNKQMNEIIKQTQEFQGQQINTIKCPYCQSTNVTKISTAGRVVSVGLFGLGSSKIGKQWHCKKCGSDF